ncbi:MULTISPECIES: hypothetical protein [unclassified Sphingomonas]|uniref:hypothetical protein n=1 Tax=unclassified Sphingomonas TaxID=196159 RepID=UPI00161811BD|nr:MULTISPECIES: hypothetical protein [unclassified Sphingomonas]MBB3345845.1 hypothetical protein [Sphingomonas sp. BK069]MBB3474560.1 hypothetical protein [Sphingomonas sp. BK345]
MRFATAIHHLAGTVGRQHRACEREPQGDAANADAIVVAASAPIVTFHRCWRR